MFAAPGRKLASRCTFAVLLAAGVSACTEKTTELVAPEIESRAEFVPVTTGSLLSGLAIPVGADRQLSLYGSKIYPWRRSTGTTYSSRNTNIASVNSKGLVHGIANGKTYVIVRYSTLVDSSLVTVGTGVSLSVSPASATVAIGNTVQLVVGGGSTGITFTSNDTSVVTVSTAGVVTAKAAGSTTVRARNSGGADATMQVSVPMVFSPASVVVAVGSTASITLGALGTQCRTGTRAYVAANPSVATVSSTGVVTGVTAGTTSVQITAGGCLGTIPVSATPVTNNQQVPAGAVAVNLHRFVGAAGAVTFSTGLPLPKGKLPSSQLTNVRVYLGGIEQPIFLKALGGLNSDGSLRSILIQGRLVAPAAGQSLAGYITFDTPRATTNLAQVAAPATLEAALLPSSAAYLVSTNAAGPMITSAQIPVAPAMLRAHEADFETMAPTIFSKTSNSFARGIAVYEHLLSHYQHFMETADPKWYEIAWKMGETYRAYGEANYAPEWHLTTEGLAVHYWFSGDERSRAVVGKMTRWIVGGTEYIYRWDKADGGYRFRGRSMLAALDCLKIDCDPGTDGYTAPYNKTYDLKTILPTTLPKLQSVQDQSGLFPGSDYAGGQKNYMIGIMTIALTRYYDEFQPDARVMNLIKASLDYTWNTQWVTANKGFYYCSINNAGDCGSLKPQPGLNNLILPAYAWYYSKTKDAKYLTIADQIFEGARPTRVDWLGFPQQFDQAMYRVANYYAWRQ